MFLIYNVLTEGAKMGSCFGIAFLLNSLKRTMKRNQTEISHLPKDILVDGTYEEMKPVNGQHLYNEDDDDDDVDDDDDTVEEDLIIGDEEAVGDEEEFDVELDDDLDEDDLDEDDLVIDADDDVDEDEDL